MSIEEVPTLLVIATVESESAECIVHWLIVCIILFNAFGLRLWVMHVWYIDSEYHRTLAFFLAWTFYSHLLIGRTVKPFVILNIVIAGCILTLCMVLEYRSCGRKVCVYKCVLLYMTAIRNPRSSSWESSQAAEAWSSAAQFMPRGTRASNCSGNWTVRVLVCYVTSVSVKCCLLLTNCQWSVWNCYPAAVIDNWTGAVSEMDSYGIVQYDWGCWLIEFS